VRPCVAGDLMALGVHPLQGLGVSICVHLTVQGSPAIHLDDSWVRSRRIVDHPLSNVVARDKEGGLRTIALG
jgi:hypothetical protein